MTPVPEGFDLADPAVQQSPHCHYAQMRDERVLYVPANDAWMVLRHQDCLEVLRDPLTYSSQLGSNREQPSREAQAEIERIGAKGLARPRTLLDNDPPSHTVYRRLVSRAFTPRRMGELRPFVESVCDELIDAWADPSSVEFMAQFAVPLPVRVITHVLNLPEDRHDDFRRWTEASTSTIGASVSDEQHIENARTSLELQQFFIEEFDQRRDTPREDLLSELLAARIDIGDGGGERPLDIEELVRIAQQLLVAGNETTAKLVTEMMRLLAETPGEWERIQADPTRVGGIVEDSLRLSSPNQGMSRIVMRDTTLAGVELQKGSRVIAMFSSANRDDALFEKPDELRADREHLHDQIAFGHGAHYCVGANLARLEAVVALERLSDRISAYTLCEDNDFEYLPSVTLRGLKRLHLSAEMHDRSL
ncbi:MAG: cytochrome P450 [Microthrixaceae bacterium]